jgi:tetratricopeptide (TPR) repeat protein
LLVALKAVNVRELIARGAGRMAVHEVQTSMRMVRAATAALMVMLLGGCRMAANNQNAQGVQMFEHGQFQAAMQQFQQAISSDPSNADSYYNLAATAHRIGVQRRDQALVSQAEQLYNQCLDYSPNHVDCHRGLAVLLVETNRRESAVRLLDNWANNQPQLADAKIELSRLYNEFSNPSEALRQLEDAVQRDPNSARAWLALGQLKERAGDLQQALVNYQRSYNINSMQADVVQRIAALNRQISLSGQAGSVPFSAGGTRVVTQPGLPNQPRY